MKKIFTLAVVVLVVWFLVRVLSGAEDTWLCQNGTWVKHGQPSNPAPLEPCR